ncbi:MAG: hypothetical protein Q7J29_14965 [Stagnimonas sp.]|nr:hypothetical protein [Stagnimonas sp.]
MLLKNCCMVLALAALLGPAHAQTLFRCKKADGGYVYQDKACSGTGETAVPTFSGKGGFIAEQPGGRSGASNYQDRSAQREADAKRQAEQVSPVNSGALPAAPRVREETLNEQRRRCEMERTSLVRSTGGKGPECRAFDALLSQSTGVPLPPEINVNNSYPNGAAPPRRVYDSNGNRWCWVYSDGAPMQCD